MHSLGFWRRIFLRQPRAVQALFRRLRRRWRERRPAPNPASFGLSQLAVESLGDVHSALEVPDELPDGRTVEIRGWVASHEPVQQVLLETATGDLAFELAARPDVQAAYGQFEHLTGFRAEVEVRGVRGPYLICRIQVGNRVVHRVFGLLWKRVGHELLAERAGRLNGRLRCPVCRGILSPNQERLPFDRCESCNRAFPRDGHRVDCLPDDVRSMAGIAATDNVSAHEYDAVAQALLGRHHRGLVLDCGAGLRTRYYPNVVNYEVVPYPTTDVVGVAERLPFADGTFDAVLCLSVLEHVKDPFAAAHEIVRVLRAGGELYCSVPLLAPAHAYPHHYYNMTAEGLRNLFEPGLQIHRAEVLPSGWPIFSLTWVLRRWAESLSGEAKETFLDMRVRDLTGDPTSYWHDDFVTTLPTETQFELAATTMILASKKDSSAGEPRDAS